MKSAVVEETGQPRDHVAAWISIHQDAIGSAPIKFERREKPARTLVVWFETPKYLIDISAWDHACCLDILVLNKETGGTDYIVCGECDGTAGLTQRLGAFLYWLNANEPRSRVE